jgi:plasmid stabilization system protein ParE
MDWQQIRLGLESSPEQTRAYVRELADTFGHIGAAELLGASRGVLRGWLYGDPPRHRATRRGIWSVWAMILHPEVIQTAFDVVTWGRFRPVKPIKKRRARTLPVVCPPKLKS